MRGLGGEGKAWNSGVHEPTVHEPPTSQGSFGLSFPCPPRTGISPLQIQQRTGTEK